MTDMEALTKLDAALDAIVEQKLVALEAVLECDLTVDDLRERRFDLFNVFNSPMAGEGSGLAVVAGSPRTSHTRA